MADTFEDFDPFDVIPSAWANETGDTLNRLSDNGTVGQVLTKTVNGQGLTTWSWADPSVTVTADYQPPIRSTFGANGVTTSFTIAHPFNTKSPIVEFWEPTDDGGSERLFGYKVISNAAGTSITATFTALAPATGSEVVISLGGGQDRPTFNFLPAVADDTALDALEDPDTGDARFTNDDGHLHIYNGTAWEDRGPIIVVEGGAIDVSTFGAYPNTGTDQTASLQAAYDYANTSGVKAVYHPPGRYLHTGLTWYKDNAYTGSTGQWTTTDLRMTVDADRAIDARECRYVKAEGLSFSYETGFEGILVDFTGTLLNQVYGSSLKDCTLVAADPENGDAAVLLSLERTFNFRCNNVFFFGGIDLVKGATTNSLSTSFGNGNTFKGCHFVGYTGAAIRNPMQAWSFYGCLWEPRRTTGGGDGTPAAVVCDEDVISAGSLTIDGSWLGDDYASEPGDAWIQFRGAALSLKGCEFGINEGAVVKAIGQVKGISVQGVSVQIAGYTVGGFMFDFTGTSASTSTGVVALGNKFTEYDEAKMFRSDTVPSGTLWQTGAGVLMKGSVVL